MYTLEYSDKSVKQLNKLPIHIKRRILKVLERIRVRPQAHLKKLVGDKYHRLRIGNYRVIIRVQNDKLILIVIEVGHRKKVYK